MTSIIRNFLNKRKWARWKKTPKDLVILHTFGKANGIPSASPFVMKLQVYLRMAKIPHKTDSKDMLGPKGKGPWISLNGVHLGDSELIIQHLNEYFKVNLNKSYSEAQLAVATCARVALEEHCLWGLAMERFLYNPTQFPKVVGVNALFDKALMIYGRRQVSWKSKGQGMGLHTKEEVEYLCTRDLRAVSAIIGKNDFLLGKNPCQDDCGVFGILSVMLWGLPNSPYEKIVKEELPNLREYCERMREIYYPDWEECIRPSKILNKKKITTERLGKVHAKM